ncbi:uncharacterized protein MEPE_04960 [Melanopsichium pennsylvanicum]|uniref:Uncharacterized protein n=1 Tax=Melanopsichium pennsylvanicum TaxID=63383 RepID=A0AAJ5C6V0_9BASI|nr:uncharacterized protein MEPE_04960 [Melanopsichium pennsylvanicum]
MPIGHTGRTVLGPSRHGTAVSLSAPIDDFREPTVPIKRNESACEHDEQVLDGPMQASCCSKFDQAAEFLRQRNKFETPSLKLAGLNGS